MTISQAFKKKNKLTKRLTELKSLLQQNNSIIEGSTSYYKMDDLMNEYVAVQNEIVDIKTRIMFANKPIQNKIFLLAELKGTASLLKGISTTEGVVPGYRGETNTYVVEWNEIKLNLLKKEIEIQIEVLQEELDSFNHITKI